MYRSDTPSLPARGCWLAAGLLAAGLAQAQPGQPPAPFEYRSALEHYQPYREESTAAWRHADHPPGSGHDHAPPPAGEGAPPLAAPAAGLHDHHHHQEPQP